MDFKKLSEFDWRSLQKFTSPQASEDLNRFLESMPSNAGQTMLIIAGVCWAAAGAAGLYTTVQLQKMAEIRNELLAAEALLPVVPVMSEQPVASAEIKKMTERMSDVYQGLEIKNAGAKITLTGRATAQFGQFREAISQVTNGGQGWKINVEELCVGRECKKGELYAALRINKVSVDAP